ncbi:MAG: hypothetical protein HY286_18925 [Planctomycetes bacterium]|nr:hypothetical protein [Planctomycetota bacterium]
MNTRGRSFVIIILLILSSLSAIVYLLLFDGGSSPVDNTGISSPSVESRNSGAADAEAGVAASAPRAMVHVANDTISKSNEARTGVEEYDIYLRRDESAAENLNIALKTSAVSEVGKGRSASLVGIVTVTRPARNESAVAIEIVAGLNTGVKSAADATGYFNIGGLYPGLSIVRFTTYKGRAIDHETILNNVGDTRINPILGPVASEINIPVQNTSEVPLDTAQSEISNAAPSTNVQGVIHLKNITLFEQLVYFSAKGYEHRRDFMRIPDPAEGRPLPPMILSRASNIHVEFSLLYPDDARPVAILLPASIIKHQAFPFEKSGMKRGVAGLDSIEFEGVPHDQAFDICMFCDTANPVPPLIHLNALDSGEPVDRTVRFAFEHRWPITGTVMHGKEIVTGAKIRAEVPDIGYTTNKMFFGNAGINRVPYPILPFARKEVSVDALGRFRFESFDMPRPAYIIIESLHYKTKVLEMPPSASELGEIQLGDATTRTSSLEITFPDSRPRTIRLHWYSGKSDETLTKPKQALPKGAAQDSKKNAEPSTLQIKDATTGLLSVSGGNYDVIVRKKGSKDKDYKVKVDGETQLEIK